MFKHILLMLSVLCICFFGTKLMAPEITERDIFGYESYNIEENGAIRDRDGAIKGWVTEKAVYDEYWNIRYYYLYRDEKSINTAMMANRDNRK